MQKTRYAYTREYFNKGTQRWQITTTILDWEQLQFKFKWIRCHELCFHAGMKGHQKCTLGMNEEDVCPQFLSRTLLE